MGRDFVGTPENIRRGRREGGGRELALEQRSLQPSVTDPVSGLASALGRPCRGASLGEKKTGR